MHKITFVASFLYLISLFIHEHHKRLNLGATVRVKSFAISVRSWRQPHKVGDDLFYLSFFISSI